MSNKDIFTERERGLEEEYFMRKERELIEKLHQKHSSESAQQQMAAATGIQDAEVIEALQELGYTPDTIMLLHLVPLIQVAWAIASQPVASMTFQTCIGANSDRRLLVRLVADH